MARASAAAAENKAKPEHDGLPDKEMPLLEHLVELRTRLLWTIVFFIAAFFLCYAFAQEIYDFLVRPLAVIMERRGGSQRMIYTGLTEAFFTFVKVAAFGAVVLVFPVFASQLWMFVAPGLYRHEKRALLPFLLISPLLFLLGAAMVYFVVMPMAWDFLLGFQTSRDQTVLPIELEAKVGEYLSLVMRLVLAFGVCFQLPVVLTLLARVGLVSAATLAKGRKYAIVMIFVVAAIVTPPDVISQVLLAIPMILLYETSIWAAKLAERARLKKEVSSAPHHRSSGSVASAASERGDPEDDLLERRASVRVSAAAAGAADAAPPFGDGMIDESDFNDSP